jgi:hypothetical protein
VEPVQGWPFWRIATFFGDRLTRIEGPLLVFERSFDMVVTDSAIAVPNLAAFEGVFRDIDAMVDRRPTWSDAAAAALPLDDATAELLADLCGKRVAWPLSSVACMSEASSAERSRRFRYARR